MALGNGKTIIFCYLDLNFSYKLWRPLNDFLEIHVRIRLGRALEPSPDGYLNEEAESIATYLVTD